MKTIVKITILTTLTILMINSIFFVDNLMGVAKGKRAIDKHTECFNEYYKREDLQQNYCIIFLKK